eukprot:TRINITY_DN1955_c0_g1_i2.p1 TRINITY_DN1955_c0_g1~~TRINITY_DN1955_c0_g1_i2.p1  ORF type:complete len:425 (+),score=29.10 TRINITY_DN1955_c0_g1_i2:140-1414(+)
MLTFCLRFGVCVVRRSLSPTLVPPRGRRCHARVAPIARRAKILQGEGTIEMVAKVQALQRAGQDIIRMEVGDPDFDTPAHITQAAIDALRNGATHYEAAGGSPALREAAASFLRRTRPGLQADAANVLCMPGGKPIIFHTIAALCQEGDEVIYPDPGFPAYETTIAWSGAKPIPLRLDEASGFRFSHQILRSLVTEKTKLIIINSPGNPTGGVLTAADLDVVADVARQSGAWVLSDEIYSQLTYDGALHDSVATREGMLDQTIVLDGCSKNYAMTGWRLGFGLFPQSLVEPARNLAINSWTCVPPFVAAAGVSALTGPESPTQRMRDEYCKRRNLVFDHLNGIEGIHVAVRPAGAMYLLANVTATGLSSKQFAERLLEAQGVSLLDGSYFGSAGDGLIRISFGQSSERLLEGCRRIESFVRSLR